MAVQLPLLILAGTWVMSTDEMTSVASAILGVHQLEHVRTEAPDVGVIVRTQAGEVVPLARELAHAARASPSRTPSPRAPKSSATCVRWATK